MALATATKAQTSIRDLMGEDAYKTLDEQQKSVLGFAERMISRMREKGTDDSEEATAALFDIDNKTIVCGVISNLAQIMKAFDKGEFARTAVLDLANYAYISDLQQTGSL